MKIMLKKFVNIFIQEGKYIKKVYVENIGKNKNQLINILLLLLEEEKEKK